MNWENDLAFLFKVFVAAVLGGALGLERELARKPAGLRTHMLVAASAALLVGLGNIIITQFEWPGLVNTDPIRILEAIIVGVSFMGAGTIIQRESAERVEGLTTSASLLFSAGIGAVVALEQYAFAVGVTVLILLILRGLSPLERWMRSRRETAD